jgi:hypothetical protein
MRPAAACCRTELPQQMWHGTPPPCVPEGLLCYAPAVDGLCRSGWPLPVVESGSTGGNPLLEQVQ